MIDIAPETHQLRIRDEDYDNYFTTGRMFDDVKGRKSDLIRFDFNFRIRREEIEKLNEVNAYIESNPMVVYHTYISYTFLHKLTVVEKKGDELLFSFETRQLRPLFTQTFEIEEDSGEDDTPPVLAIQLTIDSDKGEIDVPLVRSVILSGPFRSGSLISSKDLTSKPSTILRVSITICRIYFDMGRHISLREDSPMDRHTSDIIDAILRGEKTEKWNWVITVGHGSPQNFYVDARRMERHSCKLALALRTRTFEFDDLVVPPGEDRFVLPNMYADDMRVLIPFFYLGRHELPDCGQFLGVVDFLGKICLGPQMVRFFESWQKKVIAHCLNVDKIDKKRAVQECYAYLQVIHGLIPGSMPIAQRILHAIMSNSMMKLCCDLKERDGNQGVSSGPYGLYLGPIRLAPLADAVHSWIGQFNNAIKSVDKTYV